jgi:predicted component of type VI protein secretion system
MTVWLKWAEKGLVFPLDPGQRMVIGRSQNSDIVLDDLDVSRRHCTVHWNSCRVSVDDPRSANGTFIYGRYGGGRIRVDESGWSLLRLGEIVRVGPFHFLLGTSSRIEPSSLTWHDGLLASIARQMYDSRDFLDMPILADALEEAGCTDQDILSHCRSGGEHVRGCWVIDLLLGKK